MYGRSLNRILWAMVFASSLGCTKGQPDFDTLNSERIPSPLFEGSTSLTRKEFDSEKPITVNGECSPKITDILIRMPGDPDVFQKLDTVFSGATVNCSTPCREDGKGCFSFQLSSLTTLNKGAVPAAGQVFQFEVKGVTDGGLSKASVLTLVFTRGPVNNLIQLSSGSGRPTVDGSIKADVRVTYKILSPGATDQYAQSPGSTPAVKAKIGIAVSSH